MKTMNDLLQFARGKEKEYLKITNLLYKEFGIHSAEITLIVLYCQHVLSESETGSVDLKACKRAYKDGTTHAVVKAIDKAISNLPEDNNNEA